MYIALQPMVSLIAGILILIIPRLLNYIVAIYLILIGILERRKCNLSKQGETLA